VKFDFEHGPKDISVDGSGATLDSFVKDEVRTSSDQAITEAKAYTDEFAVSAKGRFEADESTVVQVSAALDGRVSTAWHAISARIEAVSADIENDLTAGLSGVKSYTDGLIGSLSATADARLSAKVASLSADAKTARTGMMLDMIGQADGVITVGDRAIISDDIPTLPESKVENLVLKYATKQEIVDAQYTKSPQLKIERYESDKNYIYLVDHEHAISSRIDCSDFAKDGMVETVELKDYGEGYLPENGPYLVITWNAAAGKTQTWLPVKKLFNVYKSTDSEGGLSVEGYNIYLNYDVVAKKASVTPLQEYATQLSATGGTIWQLSSHLSALDEQNARQLKMDGHIVHAVDGQALKDLIKLAGDVAIENLVKNNSLFEVRFEEPGLSALSCSFTTSDGFKLGNRDIVLVHDCDASKTQIQLDDLNAANVTVIHSGVSRYEFEDELVRRAEDDKYLSGRVDDLYAGTAKLSGGNEISGDNQFVEGTLTISSATVNGVMTVGFGKLVDAATASSLVDISSDITAQVCATSSWLSGQISAEIDDRTKAVKAVREELCAASCLVSAWSEAADVALSNTLTGVINTTSTLLSSDLKAHVTNTSNPHGVTAGQINVYLCSQTSSATELDSKFKTLSTYAEIHNTLSSDGYATQAYVKTEDQALSNALTGVINATSAALNTVLTSHTGNTSNPHGVTAGQVNAYLCSQTSSNVQLKNKFDSLSTYADIKAKLSSDGYALTSNTSSVAELNAKFSQYALSNDVSSAGQLKTKFDSLSTYANIKSQLSVDGYALTSKTSSDIQLKNKFDTLSTYANIKT